MIIFFSHSFSLSHTIGKVFILIFYNSILIYEIIAFFKSAKMNSFSKLQALMVITRFSAIAYPLQEDVSFPKVV